METILSWCHHNKLLINWSKTFGMFIASNTKLLPKAVTLYDIKIEVVNSFRLLGIELDSNLSFKSFVSNLCLTINRKLYSIKRIFQLCFSVKVQFFKTFLLPYFDYCISLCIYFSKTVLQKLCNMFYVCIFKLFKLNFSDQDSTTVNNCLKKYNLFSFQHRVLYRILLFSYKTINIYKICSCSA